MEFLIQYFEDVESLRIPKVVPKNEIWENKEAAGRLGLGLQLLFTVQHGFGSCSWLLAKTGLFLSTHMNQILFISVEIPFCPGFSLDLSGKIGPQSNGDDLCFLL